MSSSLPDTTPQAEGWRKMIQLDLNDESGNMYLSYEIGSFDNGSIKGSISYSGDKILFDVGGRGYSISLLQLVEQVCKEALDEGASMG